MVWPFGRKRPTALETLSGREWRCSSCDEPHKGMFDLAADAPDHRPHEVQYEPNSAIRFDGDFLSEDFCVVGGEHFFVRCVLDIPIHGLADKFGFGCWGTTKRENFDKYLESFDGGPLPEGAPYWSWLCNRVKPFDVTEPLGCLMHPRLERQRPLLAVDEPDHLLAIAQNEGILSNELLQIYAANGHEIV